MNTLINKRILLGISGGLAAYKSCYLVRDLIEQGAEVEVVMSRGSTKFVTPLTFQALSGRPVHSRLLDHDAESGMGHISLARWADLIVIAPATAHMIAKLAHGMADDLLTTLCLASDSTVMVVPAMNRQMWENPATQENVDRLKGFGMVFIGPDVGEQACGETGAGRMVEPAEIRQLINDHFSSSILTGRHVLITAGPTREPIDPVRYISNHSSGRMGYAVAQAAIEADAKVTLISGPVSIKPPDRAHYVPVATAAEMQIEVSKLIETTDIFISAAAVADYRCIDVSDQKIKKSNENIALQLEKNPDIIASVTASVHKPFTVGFAAETNDVSENAKIKLRSKAMDMIAANPVGPGIGFESDLNTLDIYWEDGHIDLGTATKQKLARNLIKLIANRYHEKNTG
jgi:phosphopantothenoylcysteine decarboxylase/phosphopantothenate--cysteine ligase